MLMKYLDKAYARGAGGGRGGGWRGKAHAEALLVLARVHADALIQGFQQSATHTAGSPH